jgi:hypothetical protein
MEKLSQKVISLLKKQPTTFLPKRFEKALLL